MIQFSGVDDGDVVLNFPVYFNSPDLQDHINPCPSENRVCPAFANSVDADQLA